MSSVWNSHLCNETLIRPGKGHVPITVNPSHLHLAPFKPFEEQPFTQISEDTRLEIKLETRSSFGHFVIYSSGSSSQFSQHAVGSIHPLSSTVVRDTAVKMEMLNRANVNGFASKGGTHQMTQYLQLST